MKRMKVIFRLNENELKNEFKKKQEELWLACKNITESIILIKTNYGKVIGQFIPVRCEQ